MIGKWDEVQKHKIYIVLVKNISCYQGLAGVKCVVRARQ